MTDKFDVAVVGGGLTGVASAQLLAKRGLKVAHFAPQFAKDYRTSALMMPTVAFMQKEQLIDDPRELGTTLSNIRIIDATKRLLRSPETLFKSSELNLDAFGYNFANSDLLARFSKCGQSFSQFDTAISNVEKSDDGFTLTTTAGEAFSATMIFAADGKKSFIRDSLGMHSSIRPHPQSALVADLEFEHPEQHTSVEFHYENGPFTLVPAGGNKINLVWLDEHQKLIEVSKLGAEAFQRRVEEKSHRLFGAAKPLTKAFVFPLMNMTVPSAGKDGVLLVGEAAHAFPPIGAQGLNLGLRDVEDALDAITSLRTGFSYEEAVSASEKYADMRRSDLSRTNSFVDGLYRSLVSDLLPAQALRHGGLWAMKTLPPLRKFAMQLGLGK